MIETIIQMEGKKYPFVIDEGEPNLKIESLLMVDSGRVYEEKRRFQIIKNIANPSLITLNQIYQEQTILHLIYEYVPLSISSLLEKLLPELKEEYDHLYISKVILKNVAYELSVLTDFLASIKIKTTLDFENIGLVDNFQVGQWKIKYFLGSDFQFVEASRDDFGEYYAKERKNVLIQLEKSLEIQKKSSYLPNFIIKGSKLIFTDQLSETTQRKPKTQYCAQERFEQNHYRATDPNKNFGSGNSTRSKGKWGNKTKQKHHKNSENFQHNIFQQEKLNRSFDDESQNISVTQTKSMRIEIEQQQNNGRQRKNSYKFRITTFQEISIDQDEPGEQTYDENCHQASNMPEPQFIKESAKNIQTSNETSQKSQSKNYKDKVNEAKAKAQTLLSQYFKSKANKKC